MIDRIELVTLHQRQQMLHLKCRHPLCGEQYLDAADEIIDVRDMRQHIVGCEEIGRPSVLHARVDGSGDRLERVLVGGAAVRVGRGEFDLP